MCASCCQTTIRLKAIVEQLEVSSEPRNMKIVLSPALLLLIFCAVPALSLAERLSSAPQTKARIQKPETQTQSHVKSLQIHGTHNVFRLSAKLVTGSQPEGDKAFHALAALGVKTIITVDGARPDVESARKHGMRYVQIPFGYDGLPRDKSLSLARAVRDLPGQIYLHCHHGKHRSPVASACVMVANSGWSKDEALAFLKRAGTGANYTGLWDDVRNYQAPSQAEINRASNHFPAIARTATLVHSMVRLDEIVENLQAAQKAGWRELPAHPDLDPPHEALMLREAFAELQREDNAKGRSKKYRSWLSEGENHGQELEKALRAGKAAEADRAFGKVTANCQSCHAVYRNVPQEIKNN